MGERRRNALICHGSERLESLVLVSEARPGMDEPLPPAPLQALASPALPWHRLELEPAGSLRDILQTADYRQSAVLKQVALCCQPEPGINLEIRGSYSAYGELKP